MIRALIAQPNEIDEIDLAVVNILAQLQLDQNLLSYSVGLVFANVDSLEPNLLKALAQALPFEMTGVSVPMASSQTNTNDFSLLTLAVLTSNDVVFRIGLSGPLAGDDTSPIGELAENLVKGQNQRPRLGMVFGPPNRTDLRADHVIRALSEALPGCPLFGTVAGDFATMVSPPPLIHGGDTYLDRYSLVLLYGLIRPKFNAVRIPERKFLKHRAIISRSSGHLVEEVNGAPVLEYLSKLGVVQRDGTLIMPVPFLVTDPGGKTRMLMMTKIIADGRASFSQDLAPNSTLGLVGFDETDVLRTARSLTEELKWEQFDFCLVSSCLSRNVMLGLNFLAELDQFRRDLGDLLPYVAICGGGEFCPELDDEGEQVNMFHNLVLASCRF